MQKRKWIMGKRQIQTLLLMLLVFPAWAQDTTRLRLLFVGDVMQHDSQIRAAYDTLTHTYDYTSCFQYIRPLVQQADLAMANLELTLAGPPYKGYPQFSAPDELAVGLKDAGFDVLVTANNHALDRRKGGVERTIRILDSLEIMHTGTFKDSAERASRYPLLIEKSGFRVSLLNYTYGTNGIPVTKPNIVNYIDTVAIQQDLLKAKKQNTDAIIVFMHWGAEYQDYPNKPQQDLARFCFDHGARLVVGAHPHVLQPMEWNKVTGQLVAYSLGNFVSGQQSRYRDGGALLTVELEKVKTGSSAQVNIKNAGYDLAWVYRNNENPKKYFLLPVKEFEQDTILLNSMALSALNLFVEDSKKLFANNVEVNEANRALLETSYYKVLLGSFPEGHPLDSTDVLNFYGVNGEQEGSMVHYATEKFFDLEIARHALREINQRSNYTEARIVWYYWGRRFELPARKDYTD